MVSGKGCEVWVWVDRETMIDFTELGDNEENEALARKYEKALEPENLND